ncbi:MAG: 4Fe-4S binding protein [Muribaculaceae bacterium]|nr:4Fe-4S binding protein [Muribaculaceae bacterium]
MKTIRQILAVISILAVTVLFLDFTGVTQAYIGWIAKIQFLPALLALNIFVLIGLVLLTLIFGRLYCSIICPLGIMQDGFGWLGKRSRKNRYSYSAPKNILRYIMLALMVVAIIGGIGVVVALFAPYSAYGRIAQSLLAPVWQWGNNLLASWAEAHDSYAFYNVDTWLRGGIVLAVAIATLVILGFLAWRNGRTYCNTVCPVGTVLGFLSRFSLLRPVIDTSKCNGCGLCSRNCKSACINSKEHTIDYSRCVTCFDCIDKCHRGAISYTFRRPAVVVADSLAKENVDSSRRDFLTVTATIAATAAVHAQEKTVDGGLAAITDKKIPSRKTRIVPPGAKSIKNLTSHCTACQLCVSVCPNGVLRPSTELDSLMQPESSYERGYCRPECTKCSEVCPAGAIRPITIADKSSVQIGHAVWIKDNCIPLTDGVACGNCARHCPVGAITMVASVADDETSPKIPVVNTERCIGCGACENLCPSRPFSAIYVEGHECHRYI